MVITLEAPSAVSVGLCLAHVACDKRPWLEGLNRDMDWPMSGKPGLLYLDNAVEFKSEALRRGCEQHGIELDYRPLEQPHYGGIVEWIIGTAMQMIHDEAAGTNLLQPGAAQSRALSTNIGSVDSLNVSWWCGCRPNARQMRETAVCVSPISRAMVRVLQCVAPAGRLSNVLAITASTRASSIVRGAPERGASSSLSRCCSMKRERHRPTVCYVTRWRRTTALFCSP